MRRHMPVRTGIILRDVETTSNESVALCYIKTMLRVVHCLLGVVNPYYS